LISSASPSHQLLNRWWAACFNLFIFSLTDTYFKCYSRFSHQLVNQWFSEAKGGRRATFCRNGNTKVIIYFCLVQLHSSVVDLISLLNRCQNITSHLASKNKLSFDCPNAILVSFKKLKNCVWTSMLGISTFESKQVLNNVLVSPILWMVTLLITIFLDGLNV